MDARMTGKDQKSASEADEARFNETLKRMLRTPPKPHENMANTAKPQLRSEPDSKPSPRVKRDH